MILCVQRAVIGLAKRTVIGWIKGKRGGVGKLTSFAILRVAATAASHLDVLACVFLIGVRSWLLWINVLIHSWIV